MEETNESLFSEVRADDGQPGWEGGSMIKNCFSCKLAKDQGTTFACRFDMGAWLNLLPFPDLVAKAKSEMNCLAKSKVPTTDCKAWKRGRALDTKALEKKPDRNKAVADNRDEKGGQS